MAAAIVARVVDFPVPGPPLRIEHGVLHERKIAFCCSVLRATLALAIFSRMIDSGTEGMYWARCFWMFAVRLA